MKALWLYVSLTACCSLAGSCYKTKNYGRGDCKEYTPWCLVGDMECTRDSRGCKVCTCGCSGGPCTSDNRPADGKDEPGRGGSDPAWGPSR